MDLYHKWLLDLRENAQQEEAFHKEGNTVVIAGPGTGKTRILALKVAWLLREKVVSPQGVACLTYTRMMAKELEKRLWSLGVTNHSNVFVGTVHGFSLGQVVLPFATVFDLGLPAKIRIAPSAIQDESFTQAMVDVLGSDYNPDNREHTRTTFNIYRRQRADIPLDAWRDHREIGSAIARYEEILLNLGYVDFDLIIEKALHLIINQELVRNCISARFPWFAVDEYQDLGYPLYRIVTEMLDRTSINVLAIGDPHQSIFDFAGTDPKYLINLSKRADVRPEIELELNYRSRQEIIEASRAVLNKDTPNYSEKTGGHCLAIECKDGTSQQRQVIGDIILKCQQMGIPDQEIAVLHRWRDDLQEIANFLAVSNIDFTLDRSPYYDRTIGVIKWLEDLGYWCLTGWKKQSSDRYNFDDLLLDWQQFGYSSRLGLAENTNQARVYLAEVLWRLRNPGQLLHNWMTNISQALDLPSVFEQYSDIYPDEVKEFENLLRLTRPGEELGDLTLEKFVNLNPGVQLTTLHSSKGTEFEIVIVAGVERVESNANGRRLLYVGATRAKQAVCLLFTKTRPPWSRSRYPSLPPTIKQLRKKARSEKWEFVHNIVVPPNKRINPTRLAPL